MADDDMEKLYIGQWIAALERRQSEVAAKAKIGRSYLNQLISGEKADPSGRIMLSLSRTLGIPVNALYEPPPTKAQIERMKGLRPDEIAALARLMTDASRVRR